MSEPAPTPVPTAVEVDPSAELGPLLRRLKVSFAVSTYQAGQVVTVGADANGVADVRFHHFDQAMGMARTPDGFAVCGRHQIWFLDSAPALAPRLPPPGTFDLALLTRRSHVTGPFSAHDVAHAGGELWVVNTLFSCLCVVRPGASFVPRWRPPFVSGLASEDRCHLNGMACDPAGPRYVTALGETDTKGGWRPGRAAGGCLIDVRANGVVARGLSMPHSPRLFDGALYVLDSGHGRLSRVEFPTGRVGPAADDLPGYTRGLDLYAGHAFVGLSRIRETNVFGGLPIAERRADLRCGVAIVDLTTGKVAASLYFKTGVEEVFDVRVLPGYTRPYLAGPHPDIDGAEPVWVVPPPDKPAGPG